MLLEKLYEKKKVGISYNGIWQKYSKDKTCHKKYLFFTEIPPQQDMAEIHILAPEIMEVEIILTME